MHGKPTSSDMLPGQEIVRSAWEHAESDRNDRAARVIYAAGFIDGEGWVSIKTHKEYQPVLYTGAGQKVIEPLELLSGLWGGSINQGKDKMYRWHIQGPRAATALTEMLPYLIVKRTQAEIGLRFHAEREPRPHGSVDSLQRKRDTTARYRARQRGETVETPPRPRLSKEAFERADRYRKELFAARP